MTLPVLLKSVVDELEVMDDEWAAYINRHTGELVTITEYDREECTEALEAEESEDFIALPSKFDIHEYSIIERFCQRAAAAEFRAELLSAIRGRGAFRCFKEAIRRMEIEDQWFAFRQDALESIAVSFLEAHGIEYKRQ